MESNLEPGAFEAAVVLFQLVDNFCLKVSGELQLDNIIYCMLEPFGMVQEFGSQCCSLFLQGFPASAGLSNSMLRL